MIVGNGSIAKLLKDRKGFILFAAGVSKSFGKLTKEDSERENDALIRFAGDERCIVYFSTISQYFKLTEYTIHKMKMELLVKSLFPNYCIIRLGNVWECTNPNTFINAIRNKLERGGEIDIREEYKFMISAKQINMVIHGLPDHGKHELCIFGEMKKVHDCLVSKDIYIKT